MKKCELNKLSNPLFIISVTLLILNDFYFKQVYGNVITGKLSDFAGLLAFPFFVSCLIPKYKKIIHILTAFLFIWWKSALSQYFIDSVNSLGIPIGRVIDFSDNIALISVLLSYYILSQPHKYKNISPVFKTAIIWVSSFSFIASQLPPRTAIEFMSIDKEYIFPVSIEEFVFRYNEIQRKQIEKMSCKDCNYGHFDENAGVFYSFYGDTLAHIIDISKHKSSDTIRIGGYFADIQFYSKNEDSTILKLINLAMTVKSNKLKNNPSVKSFLLHKDSTDRPNPNFAYGYGVRSLLKDSVDDKWKNKVIKEFEKRIIKKLR